MAENNLDKSYQHILNRRKKVMDRNLAEGRTMQMQGTPFNDRVGSTAGPGTPSLTGRLPNVDIVDELSEVSKAPKTTSLQRINSPSKFGKTLKALGVLGLIPTVMGIGNKAMAGDFRGMASDTGEAISDRIPVVSDIKGEEVGNAELPHDEAMGQQAYNESIVPKDGYGNNQFRFKNDEMMKEREIYNAARRAKSGEIVNNPSAEQPLLAPEGRAKKEELDAIFEKIRNR